jgi:hypothetical protein
LKKEFRTKAVSVAAFQPHEGSANYLPMLGLVTMQNGNFQLFDLISILI